MMGSHSFFSLACSGCEAEEREAKEDEEFHFHPGEERKRPRSHHRIITVTMSHCHTVTTSKDLTVSSAGSCQDNFLKKNVDFI